MKNKTVIDPEAKPEICRNWWNFKNEDDQIWLMMAHGFDTPFDPKRVKLDEMIKMYDLEHKQSKKTSKK